MCCNIHDHVCISKVLLGMLKCGATKPHAILVLRVLNAMVLWPFIIHYLFYMLYLYYMSWMKWYSGLSSFIIYFSFKTILKQKKKTKKQTKKQKGYKLWIMKFKGEMSEQVLQNYLKFFKIGYLIHPCTISTRTLYTCTIYIHL